MAACNLEGQTSLHQGTGTDNTATFISSFYVFFQCSLSKEAIQDYL